MIFGIGFILFAVACLAVPILDRYSLLDYYSEKVGFVSLVGMAMMVGSGAAYLAGVLP